MNSFSKLLHWIMYACSLLLLGMLSLLFISFICSSNFSAGIQVNAFSRRALPSKNAHSRLISQPFSAISSRENSNNMLRTNFRLQMTSTETDNPFYKGMDAYQILEVPRSADKKAIKSAYRKLVSKWHPDKFPDDEQKKKEGGMRMEKINRAYYCLEDDDRRRRYDQFGEQGVGTSAASEQQLKDQGGPGMGGFGGPGGAVDVQDISDIFDAFFGGAAGGGRAGGRGGGQRRRNVNSPVAGM